MPHLHLALLLELVLFLLTTTTTLALPVTTPSSSPSPFPKYHYTLHTTFPTTTASTTTVLPSRINSPSTSRRYYRTALYLTGHHTARPPAPLREPITASVPLMISAPVFPTSIASHPPTFITASHPPKSTTTSHWPKSTFTASHLHTFISTVSHSQKSTFTASHLHTFISTSTVSHSQKSTFTASSEPMPMPIPPTAAADPPLEKRRKKNYNRPDWRYQMSSAEAAELMAQEKERERKMGRGGLALISNVKPPFGDDPKSAGYAERHPGYNGGKGKGDGSDGKEVSKKRGGKD